MPKITRPSDLPILKTCPECGAYVEFYIKDMPHDPKKKLTGKCARCGKYFGIDECKDK
ncbi:MAG: hypothetical protein LBH43_07970 [Treponema sp.]|jgi:endogenous inhibitor of DNA gyrase (YacG/DUF329 family)|nr:hypothetical protein [Treponema sp.]